MCGRSILKIARCISKNIRSYNIKWLPLSKTIIITNTPYSNPIIWHVVETISLELAHFSVPTRELLTPSQHLQGFISIREKNLTNFLP